jgi:hypothetical protein
MTVWVLILQAILSGNPADPTNIFVGVFSTQSGCEQFAAQEQPKETPFKLVCRASEVKVYP